MILLDSETFYINGREIGRLFKTKNHVVPEAGETLFHVVSGFGGNWWACVDLQPLNKTTVLNNFRFLIYVSILPFSNLQHFCLNMAVRHTEDQPNEITPFEPFEFLSMQLLRRDGIRTFQRLSYQATCGLQAVYMCLVDSSFASYSEKQNSADLFSSSGKVLHQEYCLEMLAGGTRLHISRLFSLHGLLPRSRMELLLYRTTSRLVQISSWSRLKLRLSYTLDTVSSAQTSSNSIQTYTKEKNMLTLTENWKHDHPH